MKAVEPYQTFEQKAPEVLADLAKHIERELIEKHEFNTDEAKQVGIETAQRIAAMWGGSLVYIPRNLSLLLNARDKKIYDEFNGVNHLELALKYNVSMQWVYKIVKKVNKEEIARRQLDLFS